MKKTNQGITLVALVITIIILLILAGITISQLTGSGLFENARLAEEKSKNAQEKEDGILGDYENKIGEYVGNTTRDNQNLNVVSGTYTGTGGYGESNKNTLAFDKVPQLIIISSVGLNSDGSVEGIIFIQGCEYSTIGMYGNLSSSGPMCYSKLEWNNGGKTVSWYSSLSAGTQMNDLNDQYKYVAIF